MRANGHEPCVMLRPLAKLPNNTPLREPPIPASGVPNTATGWLDYLGVTSGGGEILRFFIHSMLIS